jgi:hypothetical protein
MRKMLQSLTRALPLILVATLPALAATAAQAAQTQIGVLSCQSVPGTRINLIIRSTTDIQCTFTDSQGVLERYVGETGIAFGADLTFGKSDESFAFTVISTTSINAGGHTLAGKYLGGKASASLGVGVGVAILVGGDSDNFSLQPIALEGNRGFGAAAGLGFLYIEKAR